MRSLLTVSHPAYRKANFFGRREMSISTAPQRKYGEFELFFS